MGENNGQRRLLWAPWSFPRRCSWRWKRHCRLKNGSSFRPSGATKERIARTIRLQTATRIDDAQSRDINNLCISVTRKYNYRGLLKNIAPAGARKPPGSDSTLTPWSSGPGKAPAATVSFGDKYTIGQDIRLFTRRIHGTRFLEPVGGDRGPPGGDKGAAWSIPIFKIRQKSRKSKKSAVLGRAAGPTPPIPP